MDRVHLFCLRSLHLGTNFVFHSLKQLIWCHVKAKGFNFVFPQKISISFRSVNFSTNSCKQGRISYTRNLKLTKLVLYLTGMKFYQELNWARLILLKLVFTKSQVGWQTTQEPGNISSCGNRNLTVLWSFCLIFSRESNSRDSDVH